MSLVLVSKQATAPVHPFNGQLWVDTTDANHPVLKQRVHDGWSTIASSASVTALGTVLAALDTAATALTALPVDFTDDASEKDLDTDAKRVAAMNATNTAVNALIAALKAIGA